MGNDGVLRQKTEKKNWFKKVPFASFDRGVAVVSLLFGFASTAIAVFSVIYIQPIPLLYVVRDIFIFVSLFLITVVLSWMYWSKVRERDKLIQEQGESIRILNNLFKNIHMMNHKYRDITYGSNICLIPTPAQLKIDENGLKTFKNICASITYDLRVTLKEFYSAKHYEIDEDIAISVKLLLPPSEVAELLGDKITDDQKRKLHENNQWMITAFRDHHTYQKYRSQREVLQRYYSLEKNTAFNHITTATQNCFISNDLKSLGKSYLNENSDWQKFYNATIVVPIRYFTNDPAKFRCFGALAVDSLNQHKYDLFENEACIDIVGNAADLIANYFLILALKQPQGA